MLELVDLAAKRRAAGVVRRLAREEGDRARAQLAVDDAEKKTRGAVDRLEELLADLLTSLVGRRAPDELAFRVAWARKVASIAVGFERATRARKKAGAPLVCVGNTRARWPETWKHGALGCALVYHGQWRRAQSAELGEQEAVGPRCRSCNARITEDRRRLLAHLS